MKFPRQARLNSGADYRFVFAGPAVSKDRFFRVLSRGNGRDYCRLGMAVSRKVCRHAAGRNRLKRVIRESFRIHQDELAGNGGNDIVVLPFVRAASICNRALFESLRDHWLEIRESTRMESDKMSGKHKDG
jgi:ribonuclease P protein component